MTVHHFNPNSGEDTGAVTPTTQLIRLKLEEIETDPQVRSNFEPEKHAKLMQSLTDSGQIMPILTYFDSERSRHILIDGERRFRAAKELRLETLEAVVFAIRPTQGQVALVQLVIDEQREALDPIDKALGYTNALETNGMNATQLAAHIGVSHTTVTRTVSLLELPNDMKADIRSGKLSARIARELVRLEKEELIRSAWEQVKAHGLNAEKTERLVSNLLKPKKKSGRPKAKDKHVYKLSGYEATVSPKKIILIPNANGKPRTPEQMLAALEMLVVKVKDDIAKQSANVQNGTPAAVTAAH
jgi:ParB family chromosome partitioning protein